MALRYSSVTTAAVPGRGGSSMVTLGEEAYIFGGADRNGTLYGDLMAVRPSSPAPSPSSCPYRLSRLHGSGGGVEGRSGLPVPGIGGHAGVAMEVHREGGEVSRRMLLFGGIDFSSGEVSSSLLEYSPQAQEEGAQAQGAGGAGGWRALGHAEEEGKGKGKGEAGPKLGEPRLVQGEHIPGGRTGHSFSSVPPPILLHLPHGTSLSAYPTLPLWAVPGYTGPAQAGAHAGMHRTGPISLSVLFAGSSPESGPLNDCWLLVGGPGSGSGSGSGAGAGVQWEYAWREVETGGEQPKPRELHHAWVRPAVLGLLGDASAAPTGCTLVHVLHPPALCVYGGRGMEREGAPREDLAVLTLHPVLEGGGETGVVRGYKGVWLPSCRTGTGGHAAGAGVGTGRGLEAYVYGGQTSTGELVGDLWHVDARNGVEVGSSTAAPPPALAPATWQWVKHRLQHKQGEGEAEELAVRFASSACVLGGSRQLCIFGGMTVLEDTCELVVVDLPTSTCHQYVRGQQA